LKKSAALSVNSGIEVVYLVPFPSVSKVSEKITGIFSSVWVSVGQNTNGLQPFVSGQIFVNLLDTVPVGVLDNNFNSSLQGVAN
jgi:hypothetical protein